METGNDLPDEENNFSFFTHIDFSSKKWHQLNKKEKQVMVCISATLVLAGVFSILFWKTAGTYPAIDFFAIIFSAASAVICFMLCRAYLLRAKPKEKAYMEYGIAVFLLISCVIFLCLATIIFHFFRLAPH